MVSSLARCRICNEEITFTIGNPVELGFHMIDRHSSGSVVQYSIHEDEKICPARRSSGGKCAGECRRPTGRVGGGVKLTDEEIIKGTVGGKGSGHDDSAVADNINEENIRKVMNDENVKRVVNEAIKGLGNMAQQKATEGRETEPGKESAGASKKCPGRKGRKKRRSKGLYKTTLETWTTGGCNMICPGCKKEVKPLLKTQKNKVAFTSLGATFLLSCWPFCFLFPLFHKCSVDMYCPNCKTKLGVYDTATGAYNTNSNVVVKNQNVPNIRR